MADMNRSLVQNENAAAWLDEMSLPIAVKAHTGDPEHFKTKPHVYNRMVVSQKSIIDGIDTVRRLTKDETKTTPVKHEAAERVADKVEADLVDTMNQMNGEAELESARAYELIGETFQPDVNKAFQDSIIYQFFRENVAKPNGISEIRDFVVEDKDAATVLWGAKTRLLGLAPTVLESLKMDAVEAHGREAMVLFKNANMLRETANKYPQIIRSMKASFFNPALANRSRSTRVDV